MIPSTTNEARMVADGFYLFGRKPTYLVNLTLPRLTILKPPLNEDAMEIFRAVRISDGKVRHDKSNITYDLHDDNGLKSLVLNELYLTSDFGIAVSLDPELAQFEFTVSVVPTEFSLNFEFKTLDGYAFEPTSNFKVL
ncbi:MAG TPA: hypothetical protein V6C76_03270 [Drouetiella sp.]